jgi:urease accessory protein
MGSLLTAEAIAASVGRHGHLKLAFERRGERTVQTYAEATTPWYALPSSQLDDTGCAYVWLMNTSGGLVGGDRVTMEATVASDCHVVMTTPSATRIYRTLEAPVEQQLHIAVGSNARLEWVPDVTIPFAGSKFRQRLEVDLAAGATAIVWDPMASGRIARAERWAFAEYDNEIRINTAAETSVLERGRIQAEPNRRPTLAGEWDYVATVFVVGEGVSEKTWAELEETLALMLDQWPGRVLAGVSQPAISGVAMKILARAAPDLTTALEAVRCDVRRLIWQLPTTALRRY